MLKQAEVGGIAKRSVELDDRYLSICNNRYEQSLVLRYKRMWYANI